MDGADYEQLQSENKGHKRHIKLLQACDDSSTAVIGEMDAEIENLKAENKKLKAELELQRWIPIGERLPEETGYYQVVRLHNPYPTTREYYADDCPQWVSKDVITHWKPIILPTESPKGGE